MRPDGTGRSFWDRRTVSAGVVLALVVGLLIWLLVTSGERRPPRGGPDHAALARQLGGHHRQAHDELRDQLCHVPTGSPGSAAVLPAGHHLAALSDGGPAVLEHRRADDSSTGASRVVTPTTPSVPSWRLSEIPARYLISPDWEAGRATTSGCLARAGRLTVAERSKVYDTVGGGTEPGEYNQLAGFDVRCT